MYAHTYLLHLNQRNNSWRHRKHITFICCVFYINYVLWNNSSNQWTVFFINKLYFINSINLIWINILIINFNKCIYLFIYLSNSILLTNINIHKSLIT